LVGYGALSIIITITSCVRVAVVVAIIYRQPLFRWVDVHVDINIPLSVDVSAVEEIGIQLLKFTSLDVIEHEAGCVCPTTEALVLHRHVHRLPWLNHFMVSTVVTRHVFFRQHRVREAILPMPVHFVHRVFEWVSHVAPPPW
jgi:hypothetical protein